MTQVKEINGKYFLTEDNINHRFVITKNYLFDMIHRQTGLNVLNTTEMQEEEVGFFEDLIAVIMFVTEQIDNEEDIELLNEIIYNIDFEVV